MSGNMYFQRPCVVTAVQCGNHGTKDGTSNSHHSSLTNSISGILIDSNQGLVLTHGSLLIPFLKNDSEMLNSLDRNVIFDSSSCNVYFEILLQEFKRFPGSNKTKHVPATYFTELVNCSVNRYNRENSLQKCSGKLVCIFKIQKFKDAVQQLMPPESGWQFHENSDVYVNKNFTANENESSLSHSMQDSSVDRLVEALLPRFILICMDAKSFECVSDPLSIKSASECNVGDVAEVIATPFGDLSPEVFMNCYSKGVMSNLSGVDNVLLLTDARCIPGSEGGALYVRHHQNKKSLVGMIVAPLCWKNNEWIGLALACSMAEIYSGLESVLSSMPSIKQIESIQDGTSDLKRDLLEGSVCSSVVLIRSGSTWGSGVLIDQQLGLLLTCGHVIRWGANPVALVKFLSREKCYTADILYNTPSGKQFDMAVLQIRDEVPDGVKCQPLSSIKLNEGLGVRVTGHALFDEDRSLTPLVTVGCISKVTKVNQIPVLIQSTCAVHAGASGGVVTDQYGHLLGMVVCNAKDISSGASFPHINLSIPLQSVWSVIDRYRKSKDTSVLKALHVSNSEVTKLWNLGIMETTRGKRAATSSKL